MSAEEGNGSGLSLEGLAQRLETQAQKLQTLERENAELRSEVAELKGSDTGLAVEEPASSSPKRRVSRSWLLRNAGAAAVGTMAAGALLARDASVAKANHFAPGISVDYVITHLETAGLTAVFGNAPFGEGVVGLGKTNGVRGNAPNGEGVRGEGKAGVVGKSSTSGWEGVYGQHTGSGYGVIGDGSGANFAGVLGRNGFGAGVRGEGVTGVFGTSGSGVGVRGEGGGTELGIGVFGKSFTREGVRGEGAPGVLGEVSSEGHSGVLGRNTGSGYGVVGEGRGADFFYAGVLGRNPTGYGVRGEGNGNEHAGVSGSNPSGPGVHGSGTFGIVGDGSGANFAGVLGSNSSGYGGQFEGGKAQLKLNPKGIAGKPTSGAHTKGEIYLDSAGSLFVCAANGTPGTWRKVTTTAV
jgi:hypothetical protein